MVNTSTHSTTLAAAAAAFVAAFGLPLLIGSASLAVPLVVAGPTTECSVMAHPPAGQTDPGSGNPLTRPGQLADLNQPPAPNSDMPMDCIPIGHG
jgi:hypothetical protein